MARELKIGIAVIGLLLVVFCGLLAKRLTKPTKLPLTKIASPDAAKPNTTAAKTAAPGIRPTTIPPQAEPNKSQGDYWTPSTGQSSGNSTEQIQTPDRYAGQDYSQYPAQKSNDSANVTATQPYLQAAPLPIQDLENKEPAGSAGAVPYQSAYAGASDNAEPNTTSTAANTQQPVDPFQSGPAKRVTPPTTSPAPATPYQLDPTIDNSNSSAMNRPYGQASSANQPSTPSSDPYQAAQSAGASLPQQYPSESYSNLTSSRAKSSNVPAQYGSDQSNSARPVADNAQWSGTSTTGNVLPTTSTTPVERNGEKYNVQPNDTFWTISERMYGTGAYFKALYEYNRRKHRQADELVIGQELLVPDENVLRRHYPDLCPRPRKTVASTEQRLMTASTKMRGTGRVYQVVAGDTLYDIAKFELGKSSRWAEIYELNRDILGDDFDYLRAGTELILPADSAPLGDSVTRQPEQAVPNNSWR